MAVAITGIALPIALSFILGSLTNATSVQAFAAGAALCSTSLGTTFTILSTSKLNATRLGIVLTSAATMDDVVGLVMVQVIAQLGSSEASITAVTVVRPILVSLAFAILLPAACRFIVRPVTLKINERREQQPQGILNQTLCREETPLLLHTALLISLCASASYAGTSNLFAAYLAGAAISWWDSEVPHVSRQSTQASKEKHPRSTTPGIQIPQADSVQVNETENCQHVASASIDAAHDPTSGISIFTAYYSQPLQRILKSFFFASIGFSIPISQMFSGPIVWRGLVYSILMALAKMSCGLWLVRVAGSTLPFKKAFARLSHVVTLPHFWGRSEKRSRPNAARPADAASTEVPTDSTTNTTDQHLAQSPPSNPSSLTTPNAAKPLSLYPPAILSFAMVARGEIGFLISSIAQSNGLFTNDATTNNDDDTNPSDIFLVITWAIVLCTLVGPVCVGLLVRRVKRLQTGRSGSARDVLGVWGVS